MQLRLRHVLVSWGTHFNLKPVSGIVSSRKSAVQACIRWPASLTCCCQHNAFWPWILNRTIPWVDKKPSIARQTHPTTFQHWEDLKKHWRIETSLNIYIYMVGITANDSGNPSWMPKRKAKLRWLVTSKWPVFQEAPWTAPIHCTSFSCPVPEVIRSRMYSKKGGLEWISEWWMYVQWMASCLGKMMTNQISRDYSICIRHLETKQSSESLALFIGRNEVRNLGWR